MASNNHRDVSFRRSFHSDRDLRAVYNLFDAPSREKALPERYSVDGLEAPRNSLDIASMGIFTEYLRSNERRHSENIPIGYELPRSHTVCGRRTDVSPLDLRLRTRIPELTEDLHKPRSSSVVARLMGLDPMPGINNKPSSSSSKLPPSQPEIIPLSAKVLVGVLDSTITGACDDGFGYEHLPPFLHPHPQEDKLQELKKELKERRSSSQPNRLIQKNLTIPSDNGLLLKVLPSSSLSSSSSSSSTPAVAAPENLDLLDTLEFLHVNRQIFMKALQDPPHSILNCRHMPSRSHGSPSRQHGSNLSGMPSKTAASCRKQSSQSVTMDSKLSKPLQKNAFEQVHRELAPSKIVVLKPTLEKAFPGLQIKLSAEDRNELESRSNQSNRRGVSSKGRKDPREIAKEILKQVQDDVGRKLSKASEAEKEKKQQQIMSQNRGETTGTSDSDGCYTPPSRRASHRSISRSLPNSPRILDRFQEIKKPADDNFLQKNRSTTSPVSEPKPSYVSSSVLDSSSVNRSKSDRFLLPKKTCNSPVSPPPPKSLARSRSVPTGAGTKLFAGEKEEQNQRTSSATAKNTQESSLPRGKISGFRSNLSLSRKKELKNQNGSPVRGEASRPTKIGQGKEGRKLMGSNQQNSVAKSCSDEWVPDTWRFVDFSSNRNQKFSAGPPVDSSHGRAIGSLTSLNGMEWRTTDAVDNSSESSVEKCDQPSPVSVLRMPYAHGSPSTMNNQNRADSYARQDLSLLQLKFRGKALTGKESRSQRNGDSDELTWQILESFTLDELMYNERWASEVSYIRDILVVSGLSKSKSTVVCCFSCDHGLNPRVFHIMEKLYATKQKKGGRPEDAIHRRLLFDLVDEAFLKGLAKPVETNIITCNKNNHSLDYRYLHTGNQMMNLLWSNLSVVISTMPSLSHQIQKGGEKEEKEKEEEEEEEDLASLDISKSPSWIPSETETGEVVLDVEKLMFKDLVEELLFDFGLRYR